MKRSPTLGFLGGLEAGPRRPAVGKDAGPPIQALMRRKSSSDVAASNDRRADLRCHLALLPAGCSTG